MRLRARRGAGPARCGTRRRRARGRQPIPAHPVRPPPGASTSLADELEVDRAIELALAAALDGRLGAAMVADLHTAARLLDRAGRDGGRALVVPSGGARTPSRGRAGPRRRAAARPRPWSRGDALALAAALLRDAWVVDVARPAAGRPSQASPSRAGGRVFSATGTRAPPGRRRRVRNASWPSATAVTSCCERAEAAADAERAAAAALERAASELSESEAAAGERDLRPPRGGARPRRGRRGGAPHRGADRAPPQRPRRRPECGTAGAAAARARGRAFGRSSGPSASGRERERRLAAVRSLIAADESSARPMQRRRSTRSSGWQRRSRPSAPRFEADLAADREAGEHVGAELRQCAQQEARCTPSFTARASC